MEAFTIHCPLGNCHGAVQLRRGMGVYYVQAYTQNPQTPVGYSEPESAATVGGSRFVDERRRRELTIECTDGHYLRLHLADESLVDAEECVYGPVETTAVRCPGCQYNFGEWSSFLIQSSGPTERTHELLSITDHSPENHTDISELSRDALAEHDRFAHRRTCPNCGLLVALNYGRQ